MRIETLQLHHQKRFENIIKEKYENNEFYKKKKITMYQNKEYKITEKKKKIIIYDNIRQ